MRNLLCHLFLPHYSNNQRAKILHHESILAIVAFFLALTLFSAFVHRVSPQVLGDAINISTQQLLDLTNEKRSAAGVAALTMNSQLTQAAQAKADFMFKHDFWAHTAPDGTTPWDFIKQSGYTYVYAGENLARGFTSTSDVVNAWMASPDHRENLLSPNYKDVGFAVQKGNLTGEKDTVLIVQMFGSTTLMPPPNSSPRQSFLPSGNALGGNKSLPVFPEVKQEPLINSRPLMKTIALFFITIFMIVLLVDIVIIRKKNLVRVFEHNIDHILFLGFILLTIGILGRGIIF